MLKRLEQEKGKKKKKKEENEKNDLWKNRYFYVTFDMRRNAPTDNPINRQWYTAHEWKDNIVTDSNYHVTYNVLLVAPRNWRSNHAPLQ